MELDNASGEQIDVYKNDIELYLSMYCEENGIQDLKKETQSVWNGALRYVRRHVFPDRKMLKSTKRVSIPGALTSSTYNAYDYDLVDEICDIYIDLCFAFDKEISILGFSNLTGIDDELIYSWGVDEKKLGSSSSNIFKKLYKFREESLSNILVSGKKNPVGVLGVLNRRYGWNLPGVSREQAKRQSLPESELPKLGKREGEITQENCGLLTDSNDNER